jgi:hypothetical protein
LEFTRQQFPGSLKTRIPVIISVKKNSGYKKQQVPRVRKLCKEYVVLKKSKNSRKSKNSKNKNPPNVPQARRIENLSGHMCQQVYEGEWEAKSEAKRFGVYKQKSKISAETF